MAIDAPKPWFVPTPSATPEPRDDTALRVPSGAAYIPTGVPDFDHLTGGLPAGSVVLLSGEAGSGHQEFALTSSVHLMLHYDDPALHRFFLGSAKGPFQYPRGVVYVSVSRSREQVLREVEGSFEPSYHQVLLRHLKFHDLSPAYFADTVVPTNWSSVPSSLLSGVPAATLNGGGPLRAIADSLEGDGEGNLVIVDSLTDLLVRKGTDPDELMTLVKGLRRRAKDWNGLVYLLLSKGVAPPSVEQALIDSVDGVLSFSWSTSPLYSHRQRQMLIEKFMPVLAHVPHEHQGRFVIRVSAVNGLVTTQYERI
ncbi:MAG: RAD55 family ATPase [Thermoplasmata archaeon]|nr:RAD55 family ATPase [Thermoplasmata archaeon]